MNLDDRLQAKGPKRILALDGGGVRGILSLAILKRIETILRARAPDPESFRLADYFDLIGGTSTGSIIASGLALGLSVDRMIELYRTLSGNVFKRSRWSLGLFGPKFSRRALADALDLILGDITLGSNRLRTGLAIIAKRADRGSVWILHNNPRGKYYRPAPTPGQRATPNADIPLASAILASTAAPTYFAPEIIPVADGEVGAFVDGGVSPHNDPSLHLLMLANLKGYRFGWSLGAENLMLTSVGTGWFRASRDAEALASLPSALQAVDALKGLIDDGSRLVQILMQWASQTPTPRSFDREMGDLEDDRLTHEPLLHYLRYDGQLEIDWLQQTLKFEITEDKIQMIRQMDNPLGIELLFKIGAAIATAHVKEEHFPTRFDGSAS